MGAAIPPARYFTRETYRIIRPEGNDYDAVVWCGSPAVGEELKQLLQELRVWNQVGAPIWRDLRAAELRLQVDAGSGLGWRLDGVVRDAGWGDYSRAVAADWTEDERELHQVQKELWAVHRVLTVDGEAMRGQSLVVWTDCKGVVRYLRVGMGGSDVLTGMAKKIFWLCVKLGIRLTVEWVKWTQMVVSGVDGLSRFQEFMARPAIFQWLHRSRWWGCRDGFGGFGVDLFATGATRQGGLPYCQRGGGDESLGDARLLKLDPAVNYWVVPPLYHHCRWWR
jgi:hypothetical protein